MKRITYLLSAIAIVAAVVAVGYFFRYRSSVETPERGAPAGDGLPQTAAPQGAAATTTPMGGALPAPGQKFGVVTEGPVRDFFVDPQNNLFLVQPDGQVVKISGNKPGSLSATTIADLVSASFSYDGQKTLVVFGDRDAPQTSSFDVPTKSWRPLPTDVRDPVWAPGDHRIAYLVPGDTSVALTTLDLGNPKSKPQTMLRLHGEDLRPAWPATNKIFLAENPSALYAGSLWQLDTRTRAVTPFLRDQFGLAVLWNRAADRGLVFVSHRGGRGGTLKLVDAKGTTLNGLGIATLPSKCIFYDEVVTLSPTTSTATGTKGVVGIVPALLCAIPRDASALNAHPLPDAHEKRAIFTEDDIYRINLLGGDVKTIFDDPAYALDAVNLKVFNKKLFFVNRFDEKLYAVSLD